MHNDFATRSQVAQLQSEVATLRRELDDQRRRFDEAERKAARDAFKAEMEAMPNRITIKLGIFGVSLMLILWSIASRAGT